MSASATTSPASGSTGSTGGLPVRINALVLGAPTSKAFAIDIPATTDLNALTVSDLKKRVQHRILIQQQQQQQSNTTTTTSTITPIQLLDHIHLSRVDDKSLHLFNPSLTPESISSKRSSEVISSTKNTSPASWVQQLFPLSTPLLDSINNENIEIVIDQQQAPLPIPNVVSNSENNIKTTIKTLDKFFPSEYFDDEFAIGRHPRAVRIHLLVALELDSNNGNGNVDDVGGVTAGNNETDHDSAVGANVQNSVPDFRTHLPVKLPATIYEFAAAEKVLKGETDVIADGEKEMSQSPTKPTSRLRLWILLLILLIIAVIVGVI
ncbi:hypothetical protein HDU76_009479, partial [Blyttiomyces sp. JEL0837]